jgi:hypothetical protein
MIALYFPIFEMLIRKSANGVNSIIPEFFFMHDGPILLRRVAPFPLYSRPVTKPPTAAPTDHCLS